MSNSLPFMKFFVADYLSDTMHLDVIESGAYLHLLMNYWQTGGALVDDDRRLARIAKCTDEQWLNVRSTIVEFFVQQDGVLVHARVERDLDLARSRSNKASAAGKKSAQARASKAPETTGKSNKRSTDVEQTLNNRDTDTDTDTDIKKDTPSLSPPSENSSADGGDADAPPESEKKTKPKNPKPKSRNPETPLPEPFPLTDELIAYAASKGLDDRAWIENWHEGFLLAAGSKTGKYRYSNWCLAWKKWLLGDINKGLTPLTPQQPNGSGNYAQNQRDHPIDGTAGEALRRAPEIYAMFDENGYERTPETQQERDITGDSDRID